MDKEVTFSSTTLLYSVILACAARYMGIRIHESICIAKSGLTHGIG